MKRLFSLLLVLLLVFSMLPTVGAAETTATDPTQSIWTISNYTGTAENMTTATGAISGTVLVEHTNVITDTTLLGDCMFILLPGASLTMGTVFGGSLMVITGANSTLTISGGAVFDNLYVAGPGHVSISGSITIDGTAVLQQTGVVEINSASQFENLVVPQENGIFLSATAAEPAKAYDGGTYLRVEPHAEIRQVTIRNYTDPETGAATTTVAFPAPEELALATKQKPSTAMLAGYDASGKLVTTAQGSYQYGLWTFTANPQDAAAWKVFFLDGETAPKCAAYAVAMEEDTSNATAVLTSGGQVRDSASASELMRLLRFMANYEDESFHPEIVMKRQEAAKVIATFANVGDDISKLYASSCPMEDVDKESWSASYIAYCAHVGMVDHMVENNCFNPTGEITISDAAAMLLCLLGYSNDHMNFRDPETVLRVGQACGLFDGFPEKTNLLDGCTRGHLALMIENTLLSPVAIATLSSLDTLALSLPATASALLQDEAAVQLCTMIWAYQASMKLDRFGNLILLSSKLLYEAMYEKQLTYEVGDPWGRPVRVWTRFTNQGQQIGQVTYRSTNLVQTIYTDATMSQLLKNQLEQGGYSCSVYVDGKLVLDGALTLLLAERISDYTGRGVQTELYVDDTAKTITVVIINTYLMQVVDIMDDPKTGRTRYYLGYADGRSESYITSSTSYSLGDWLLFNRYGTQWRNFTKAEKQTAVITEVGKSSVKLGQTVYQYAATYGQLLAPDARKATPNDIGTTVTFALDLYHNLMYLDFTAPEPPAQEAENIAVFLPDTFRESVNTQFVGGALTTILTYDSFDFEGELTSALQVDETLHKAVKDGNLLIRYAAENGVACWKESGHIGTAELWDDQLVIDGYRVTEDTALITVTWDAEFEQYRYTTVAHVEALPKNPAPESAQYFFAADRSISHVVLIYK